MRAYSIRGDYSTIFTNIFKPICCIINISCSGEKAQLIIHSWFSVADTAPVPRSRKAEMDSLKTRPLHSFQ